MSTVAVPLRTGDPCHRCLGKGFSLQDGGDCAECYGTGDRAYVFIDIATEHGLAVLDRVAGLYPEDR